MPRIEPTPKLVALVGGALCMLALVVPWFRAAGLSHTYLVTPASVPHLQAVVWLEFLLLLAGVVLLAVRSNPTLLGLVGALYLNTAGAVWVFGSKTSAFLPKDLLPDDFTVALEWGADIGLLGSILLMVGCCLVLAERTWPEQSFEAPDWMLPLGVLAAVVLIVARDATWLRLQAPSFGWDLSADVIPLLGDALLIFMATGALLAVAMSFLEVRWLPVVSGVIGLVVVLLGVVGRLANSVLIDLADWARNNARFLDKVDGLQVDTSFGPYVVMAAGLVLVALAVFRFIGVSRGQQGNRRQPAVMPAATPPSAWPF